MGRDLVDLVQNRQIQALAIPGYEPGPDEFFDVLRFMSRYRLNGDGNSSNGEGPIISKKRNKIIVSGFGKLPKGLGYTLIIATAYKAVDFDSLQRNGHNGHIKPVYQDFILVSPDGKSQDSYRYLHEKGYGTLRMGSDTKRKVNAEDALKSLFADAYRIIPKKD